MLTVLFVMKKLTQDDVLNAIRAEVKNSSVRAVARRIGVSAAYISDVLLDKRQVSERLARLFGFEREIIKEVVFRKVA
jgi:transcriptional regulator with XRE-family HTH domain